MEKLRVRGGELEGSVHTVAEQKKPVEWLDQSLSNHSPGLRVLWGLGGGASMGRHEVISVQQLPWLQHP